MKDYLELAKPRIGVMVGLMAALGYALAGGRDGAALTWMVLGAALSSAACGALNQLLERGPDALMARTHSRPLPAGRLAPAQALAFGLATAILGLAVLYFRANPLAALCALATLVLYVGLYTPLKRVSPLSAWIGAAAGATPPLVGWAAAQNALPLQAWALFAIQFLWQMTHFLALFWLHREDYARAGFKFTPVLDPSGRLTAAQIAVHSFSIVPVSLLPVLWGMAGPGYGLGALGLSGAYMAVGLRASWTLAPTDMRRLFLASLAYLPLLFAMLWIGT